MNEQQRQEKIMEYQVLANQIQQLQNHLAQLEQHTQQLQMIHHSLQQLSEFKEKRDTFIPVGSGIFLKGTIENTQEVLMNVGASVCVKKPTNDALAIVEKQLEEVQGVIINFEGEMQKGLQHIEELKKEIQP